MKKNRIFYFGLNLAFFCIIFFQGFCNSQPQSFTGIWIKDYYLKAEVADSDAKRQQGLMFRKTLAEDEGMLFVFVQEGSYNFWMKNMQFPIDIIWVNKHKKIVYIYENAQPCQEACPGIVPPCEATFVLEVKAGFASAHNIKVGDNLDFL